jgi:CO dehydrogenase/acetyl-CoA synthase epsilon subunit
MCADVQVSSEAVHLGEVARHVLDHAQRPLVLVRAFQPAPDPGM